MRNQLTLGSERTSQLVVVYTTASTSFHLPRSSGGSGRPSSPAILLARCLPSYSSITCRSVTRNTSSYMRNLNSDGRSKKRKGCLLATGFSSSISSSDPGDGGRGGAARGGWATGFAATAVGFALEAAGLDLRVFAMLQYALVYDVLGQCIGGSSESGECEGRRRTHPRRDLHPITQPLWQPLERTEMLKAVCNRYFRRVSCAVVDYAGRYCKTVG